MQISATNVPCHSKYRLLSVKDRHISPLAFHYRNIEVRGLGYSPPHRAFPRCSARSCAKVSTAPSHQISNNGKWRYIIYTFGHWQTILDIIHFIVNSDTFYCNTTRHGAFCHTVASRTALRITLESAWVADRVTRLSESLRSELPRLPGVNVPDGEAMGPPGLNCSGSGARSPPPGWNLQY